MAEEKPTGITFWVQGIVAARNGKPYVQLSNDKGMIGQFTIAETRNVAFDLLRAASYAEADAMILQFFESEELPKGAAQALLVQFRDFRHTLDTEKIDTSYSDPEENDGKEG